MYPIYNRILASTAVLFTIGYVALLLAWECMPVADSFGNPMAVPRFEYWLLNASFPTAILLQWTGGDQPVQFFDRLLPILGTGIWIGLSWCIGWAWLSIDRMGDWLGRWQFRFLSTAIGSILLSGIVFMVGVLFGTQSWMALIVVALLATILSHWFARRMLAIPIVAAESKLSVKPSDAETKSIDASFSTSWHRRSIGFLAIASFWLALHQVFGASIPTVDSHVREVDMLAVKEFHSRNEVPWIARQSQINEPKGMQMSALAAASILVGTQEPGMVSTTEQTRNFFFSFAIGRTVNAALTIIAFFIIAISCRKFYGVLAGWLVLFLLLATPGLAELARLGRIEGAVSIYYASIIAVLTSMRGDASPKRIETVADRFQFKPGILSLVVLVAGAASASYASAILIAIPGLFVLIKLQVADRFGLSSADRRSLHNAFFQISLLVAMALLAGGGWYVRNAIQSGDPVYPWIGSLFSDRSRFENAYANFKPMDVWWSNQFPRPTDLAIDAGADVSPYTLSQAIQSIHRFTWSSAANGLLLMPLVAIGILRCRSNWKRLVGLWCIYWLSLWWFASPRMDRDWVGLLPMLAYFAASGADYFTKNIWGGIFFFITSVAILWSVLVIPIWPTSDNRILVSLESLRAPYVTFREDDSSESKPISSDTGEQHLGLAPDSHYYRQTYQGWLNHELAQSSPDLFAQARIESATASERILIVGDSDTTEIRFPTYSNGLFDRGLWDDCLGLKPEELQDFLWSNQISQVIFVWRGLESREKQIGFKFSDDYRRVIKTAIDAQVLESVNWPLLSSEAELFRVRKP